MTSVARDGRIDEHRPGVDATLQIVEIQKSLTLEVLSGMLAAYAVVTLEDEKRIPIADEQLIVIRAVQQPGTLDSRERTLGVRTNVDQLDRGAALQECFEIRRRQLPDGGKPGCGRVIAQWVSIFARPAPERSG